jgi:hypothetical protein
MYRTLCALFLALPGFKGLDLLVGRLGLTHAAAGLVACGVLFLIFAFAYRKQTAFVRQRVEVAKKD